MTNFDQNIKKSRNKQKNVFSVPDRLFNFIYPVIIAFGVCAMTHPLIFKMSIWIQVLIFSGVMLIGIGFGVKSALSRKQDVIPYKRQEGFEFIGLHDLSKETDMSGSNDIMPRNEEVHHIKKVLETVIFPQSNVKQLLCLTGQSGCGKSTILSFFKNIYADDYLFFDFSGDYNHLDGKIEDKFGNNPEGSIAKLTYSKKVVIILDQFERYFSLKDEKKAIVKAIISKLGRKNSAIIVSMREEYLADFLREFDMNDLKAEERGNDRATVGILKPLVNVIYDENNFLKFSERRKRTDTIEWERMRIKQNFSVHLQPITDGETDVVLERMGDTLFYCENQNNSKVQMDGETQKAVFLKSKCERLFDEAGIEFFEKHKNKPLIEQQIIFHMAEYDQKVRHASDLELAQIFEMEDHEILARYFDVQLASCEDYFYVSRILYLLSKCRLHHISIKKEDLEAGLYLNQFSKLGTQRFARTLDLLEDVQLIRKSVENSRLEYEIAHDFIATTFINYANSHIDRGVREGLDIYVSEFMDSRIKPDSLKKKKEHSIKMQSDGYYKNVTLVMVILTVLIALVQFFVYDPWKTVWAENNPYSELFPICSTFITSIALIYLGQMYDKVLKYYHGPKERSLRVMYVPLTMVALCSQIFYPHFLAIDGLSLAVLGLTYAFLLDEGYPETCRSELRGYGMKCAMVGFVFAGSHIMLYCFNTNGFSDYLMFAEALMISVLVLYSYIYHMSKEYLYARMMDASSERK